MGTVASRRTVGRNIFLVPNQKRDRANKGLLLTVKGFCAEPFLVYGGLPQAQFLILVQFIPMTSISLGNAADIYLKKSFRFLIPPHSSFYEAITFSPNDKKVFLEPRSILEGAIFVKGGWLARKTF